MNKKIVTLIIISLTVIITLPSDKGLPIKKELSENLIESVSDINDNINKKSNQNDELNHIKTDNPWTNEDEGDHFPCGCEWWMFYAALELDDGTRWDATATFQYSAVEKENGTELSLSIMLLYFFNRDTKKCYDFSIFTNRDKPFTFKKNTVDIKFYNSTIKGIYPNYYIHIETDEKEFILDLELNANTLPHWVAQEAADGYFPWGMGLARYGFITSLNATGNLTVDGSSSQAKGIGYYEHAYGNFTYTMKNPLTKLKDLKNNLPYIMSLGKYLLSEQKFNNPHSLAFGTDNIFGYDWIWAGFDNGWSLHSSVFHMFTCVEEGPVSGVTCLVKDDNSFCDFADMSIKYNRRLYVAQTDAYLPLDFEITATKGDKILYLICNSTTEPHIDLNLYPASKTSPGNIAAQTAGTIRGYYKENGKNVSLNGVCTIGPYRNLLNTKHNSLEISLPNPPDKFGFSTKLISNLFNFEMFFKIQLRPNPELQFYVKPCNDIPTSEQKNEKIEYSGKNLYVGGKGTCNFSNIQDAIDTASDGDKIFVGKGVYSESICINKSICLIGEDKNRVIIKPGKRDGFKLTKDNVEVTGFTVDSEYKGYSKNTPFDIRSNNNYIHNNIIIHSEWYGIYLFNASTNIIENNYLIGNEVGIWLCRSYDNIIHSNNITHSEYVGIWLWPFSNNNSIKNNNFIENRIHIQNSDIRYKNHFDKNYWDDYKGLKFKHIVDLNKDGIGFIAYRINRYESDSNPIIKPYII